MKKYFFLTFILLCFNIFTTKAQGEEEIIKNLLKEREKNINTLKEHKNIDRIMNTFGKEFTSTTSNINNSIILEKKEAFKFYNDIFIALVGNPIPQPNLQLKVKLEKINFVNISKKTAYISYSFLAEVTNEIRQTFIVTFLVTEIFEKEGKEWKTIHIHFSDNFDPKKLNEEDGE